MRVRLLIDVEYPEENVTELGELAASQPVVIVNIGENRLPIGGRLIGAVDVR